MNETTVATHTENFVPVAALTDIPVGWVLRTRVGSKDVALANRDGTIEAMDNSCSHAGGPLGDNRLKDGCFLQCPWHNAVFDVRSGAAVSGAARKPVRKYEARVDGGIIYVSTV